MVSPRNLKYHSAIPDNRVLQLINHDGVQVYKHLVQTTDHIGT